MNDREFLKQLKKFIDEQLAEPETEEPRPLAKHSNEVVYTRISELSIDLQQDYARANKDIKKMMEKKFNLKPSE